MFLVKRFQQGSVQCRSPGSLGAMQGHPQNHWGSRSFTPHTPHRWAEPCLHYAQTLVTLPFNCEHKYNRHPSPVEDCSWGVKSPAYLPTKGTGQGCPSGWTEKYPRAPEETVRIHGSRDPSRGRGVRAGRLQHLLQQVQWQHL